jgi:predicted methyltransferase
VAAADGDPTRAREARGGAARRHVRHGWGRVLGAASLGILAVACATDAQTTQFPRVDRPVAPIVTPAYSTEAARDEHGEAARVMYRLGVNPGMRVADVGAGDGYYTVRLAKRVGPRGKVYAEDVTAAYLDRLGARLAREDVSGVTLVHGTAADPRLPEASVDLALLAHMYHEVAQPYEFLYHLRASLAPGGRVAIIDNDKPTAQHGTPPALLECELAAVGYRQIDFLWLAPADGYLAVFAPPEVLPRPEAIRPCRR